MTKLYLDDFANGQILDCGTRRVTRSEIVAFAAEFDPQPMHMDEEAGRQSMLGGIAASGWHSCCLLMRMISDGFILDSSSMGAPGIDEVRWLAPMRPDDEIAVRAIVQDVRVSQSRPDRGFVRCLFEMRNQTGAMILTLGCSLMMGRRT